ncbi:hypothetical protein [Scytonema millei]|uniref:hypothetical protein n=1 Tax=Scytonema millei TaxID=1245922 RepID=UPI00398BF07B
MRKYVGIVSAVDVKFHSALANRINRYTDKTFLCRFFSKVHVGGESSPVGGFLAPWRLANPYSPAGIASQREACALHVASPLLR